MENSIYTGLSLQVALRQQMDLIANNVANMSTPGYRSQNIVFTEYLAKTPSAFREKDKDDLAMVESYGQYQNTAPGPVSNTGNPLDAALQGKGYFVIETKQGPMYTRGGNFQLNTRGELVTGRGDIVSGQNGAITVPRGAREIIISEDGTVSTDAGAIGQIKVVEFENDQILEPAGNGLYQTTAAPLAPEETKVKQGMLESSNVSPVLEMTRMIDVLRTYQNVANMLQREDERNRTMIQRLTRNS